MGARDFGDKPELRRAPYTTYLPLRSCFGKHRYAQHKMGQRTTTTSVITDISSIIHIRLSSCDFVTKPQQLLNPRHYVFVAKQSRPEGGRGGKRGAGPGHPRQGGIQRVKL